MDVKYLISRAARQYPDHIAVIDKDTRLTFREINDRANRLANGLLDLGIKKGDRVGVLLQNCSAFIEIDFALAKSGIVRIPLNARLGAPDHLYTLNDSLSNVLIFGERFIETVQAMKSELQTVNRYICVSEKPLKDEDLKLLNYEDLIKDTNETLNLLEPLLGEKKRKI